MKLRNYLLPFILTLSLSLRAMEKPETAVTNNQEFSGSALPPVLAETAAAKKKVKESSDLTLPPLLRLPPELRALILNPMAILKIDQMGDWIEVFKIINKIRSTCKAFYNEAFRNETQVRDFCMKLAPLKAALFPSLVPLFVKKDAPSDLEKRLLRVSCYPGESGLVFKEFEQALESHQWRTALYFLTRLEKKSLPAVILFLLAVADEESLPLEEFFSSSRSHVGEEHKVQLEKQIDEITCMVRFIKNPIDSIFSANDSNLEVARILRLNILRLLFKKKGPCVVMEEYQNLFNENEKKVLQVAAAQEAEFELSTKVSFCRAPVIGLALLVAVEKNNEPFVKNILTGDVTLDFAFLALRLASKLGFSGVCNVICDFLETRSALFINDPFCQLHAAEAILETFASNIGEMVEVLSRMFTLGFGGGDLTQRQAILKMLQGCHNQDAALLIASLKECPILLPMAFGLLGMSEMKDLIIAIVDQGIVPRVVIEDGIKESDLYGQYAMKKFFQHLLHFRSELLKKAS